MVTAISLSSASIIVGTGTSKAGLEAQVAQYKKQLSDCVNCASTSSSQAGKALIQSLTNRISSTQARIEAMTNAQPVRNASTITSEPATTTASPDAASGRLIDVFA